MAHNLHTNDQTGKTSFVAVGEVAWHGLGQYVKEAMTADEAIKLGGLDYEVAKRDIVLAGTDTKIDNQFAAVRTDTNDVLGIVSGTYRIIQNREAFEFFDSITEKGEAIYQTAGVLGKGEKIFVTAKLPEDILVRGEKVENYLLLTGGHDGRTPIQAGFTSIRVVCNNTLQAALKGLENKVTIQHYSSAMMNLREAARVMGMASKYVTELDQTFNRMAEVKITDKQLRSYIETVMNPGKEAVNADDFSKQFVRRVDEIMEFATGHATQGTDAAKNTLWGAYNAISGYYSWVKEYDSTDDKMKDIMFKGGAKKIEAAYNTALLMM